MTLIEEATLELRALPPEKQNEALNFIIFLREQMQKRTLTSDKVERGKRIKAALEDLADMGTFNHIEDPVVWQREIRKDRPLPGRPS